MTVNMLSHAIERVIVTQFVNLASNLRNRITPYVVHLYEQLHAGSVGIRLQLGLKGGNQQEKGNPLKD